MGPFCCPVSQIFSKSITFHDWCSLNLLHFANITWYRLETPWKATNRNDIEYTVFTYKMKTDMKGRKIWVWEFQIREMLVNECEILCAFYFLSKIQSDYLCQFLELHYFPRMKSRNLNGKNCRFQGSKRKNIKVQRILVSTVTILKFWSFFRILDKYKVGEKGAGSLISWPCKCRFVWG